MNITSDDSDCSETTGEKKKKSHTEGETRATSTDHKNTLEKAKFSQRTYFQECQ